jgi:hypothetical protein
MFSKLRGFAKFISEDKGSIRTWIAITSFVAGGGSVLFFLINQGKTNKALEDIAAAAKATEITAKATQEISKTAGGWTQLSAQMLMDESVAKFNALQERMGADPTWVPTSPDERREVLAYMNWATSLAHSMQLYSPELLAEKYGFRVEHLLSNMYVQDQILSNSSRWSSIVDLGRKVSLQAPPAGALPYPPRPARVESARFLACFDKEAKDCHARVEIMLRQRALSGEKHSGIKAPYSFKCSYTQARLDEAERADQNAQKLRSPAHAPRLQ